MTEASWVRVTRAESIPPREGRSVRIADREIAIFNLGPSTALGTGDETFLASDNECPHKGGPLCDGIVTGRSVVCPLHAWKISLETGRVERPGGAASPAVRTYPVRVESGIVHVLLPAAPAQDGDSEKVQNCQIIHA